MHSPDRISILLNVHILFSALSEATEDVYVQSSQIEAVCVHYLVPGRHEVMHELIL